jgi:cytosine/adenosine deaminase-related metal-dependent hydrolase
MEQAVRLTGARVALEARHAEYMELAIRRGRILPFDSAAADGLRYDLTGHLLLPGLINVHDHLEFNLFPRLGRGPWGNASDWAAAVYHPEDTPLKEHLRVPKKARLLWGGIKNLLSGATTVAHHNPWDAKVFGRSFPVRVLKRYGWAHSLAFSADVAERYRRTPPLWPFFIHAAEGTDAGARTEISRLEAMGALGGRTVLVHAIGATARQLETVRSHAAFIAWCPSSNLFTMGRTLSPGVLRSGVGIALGTDSALTAAGDMIDEMRVARGAGQLSADEVYPLVTANAARALRLGQGQGRIAEHGAADLIAVKDRGQTPAEALTELHPELIMIGGRVMLLSENFAQSIDPGHTAGLHRICVEGRGRWLVRAPIPRLHAAAAATLGPEIRLAGRRVCP